jgi:hypothetical protein
VPKTNIEGRKTRKSRKTWVGYEVRLPDDVGDALTKEQLLGHDRDMSVLLGSEMSVERFMRTPW